MRTVTSETIENAVFELAAKACLRLIPSCEAALQRAAQAETEPSARFALETVLENAKIAEKEKMAVCQDTGYSVILAEIGQDVHIEGKLLSDAVNDGVRRAYEDFRFRKSICDPLTRENTADNTPAALHTEIVAGDQISLTFLPKGFGSENMSRMYMLTPAKGKAGILDAIVETVKLAGSKPCPPVYVGVGIGGTFDTCAFLAKKALTREIGSQNPREDVAEIERTALERINALGIGAQGFGGKTTALGVSCEIAPTHIAGLPVAVNIQCHCVRCEKTVL
ncbi:MAG TPA: fumarate hydratase [Candidatus Borkfalkia excrementavium]|uniref:Fumarate hydratase n=1 Tax=Candidatus Borkfalkia excrementavium TaxID=2838505 RepID=A0A9D2CG71_9FIRM|nr:fumarate hydratase [Candidatus Borkfalkia excrementavium]